MDLKATWNKIKTGQRDCFNINNEPLTTEQKKLFKTYITFFKQRTKAPNKESSYTPDFSPN